MQLGHQLRDQFRTFFKIRKARKLSRFNAEESKPRIGSPIVRGEIRMTVQAGLSDELWAWLGSQGWRVPPVSPDRRHYRDIPASWVTRLFDAQPEYRVKMLVAGVSRATVRHTIDQRMNRSNLMYLGVSRKS